MGAVLGHVAMIISMARYNNPLHQANWYFIKPISHMLRGFRNFDPKVRKELDARTNLQKLVCEQGHQEGTGSERYAIGDLVMVAFYYLLCVGKYTTKLRRDRRKRKQA